MLEPGKHADRRNARHDLEPDPHAVRAALCEGSDSVADLMLVELGLDAALDDGAERSTDERYLILMAAKGLLNARISRLGRSFDTLWATAE